MNSRTQTSGLVVLTLGLAALGCNSQGNPHCIYSYPIAQYTGTPSVKPNGIAAPGDISVVDQPVLRFRLEAHHDEPPSVPLPAQSTPALAFQMANAFAARRTLRIDLQADPRTTPYDELRIAWDASQVQSYRLISYETRVAPSSTPGITLNLEIFEVGQPPDKALEPSNVGTLSAWMEQDHQLTQQGPGLTLTDLTPFQYMLIDTEIGPLYPIDPPICQ